MSAGQHDLICRVYGEAPRTRHILSEPVSDYGFWRERLHDRWGEVVFGMVRPGGLVVVRCAGYPPGVFRVPSGGVGHGEDVMAALQREVHEELGARCEVLRYAGMIQFVFPSPAGGGSQALVFPSHCFLLQGGGRAGPERGPLSGAADSEVDEWRELSLEELERLPPVLAALDPPWRDWGCYRARSTALVAGAWREHLRAQSSSGGEGPCNE